MSAKLYSPTEAMKTNSTRGKALKNKKKKTSTTRSYGSGGDSAFQMTSKSFDEALSLEDVKKVYMFLNKQQDLLTKNNLDTDGQPSDNYLDWLTAGATAGLAWSSEILQKNDILKSGNTLPKDKQDLDEEDNFEKHAIIKATDNELMQVTYVAMLPNSIDLHGDYTTEDEVRKAHASFSKSLQRANLFHMTMTDTFDVLESYIAPTEFILGDHVVEKGTWLITLKVFSPDVWLLIKSGEISGISIGAMAQVEDLEG